MHLDPSPATRGPYHPAAASCAHGPHRHGPRPVRRSWQHALVAGLLHTLATDAGAQSARPGEPPNDASRPGTDTSQAESGLHWDPAWRKSGPYNYALAFGSVAATLVFELTVPVRDEPYIEGGFLFDEAVRDLLVFTTREGRNQAGVWSDLTFYGGMAYPVIVDVGAVAWLGHGRGDIAIEMLVMDLEAMGVAGFVSRIAQKLGGRERPLTDECLALGGKRYHKFCPGNPDSLLSGHTALAFAGAALTCTHHSKLALYGGGFGDKLACYTTMTTAVATGLLRVGSDMHYPSDILLGAGLGLATGFLFPYWFHYTTVSDGELSAYLAPYADQDSLGLSLVGYSR